MMGKDLDSGRIGKLHVKFWELGVLKTLTLLPYQYLQRVPGPDQDLQREWGEEVLKVLPVLQKKRMKEGSDLELRPIHEEIGKSQRKNQTPAQRLLILLAEKGNPLWRN